MKAIVGISTRMILLTLIYIADCFDESSDSGNSSDGGGIHSPGCRTTPALTIFRSIYAKQLIKWLPVFTAVA